MKLGGIGRYAGRCVLAPLPPGLMADVLCQWCSMYCTLLTFPLLNVNTLLVQAMIILSRRRLQNKQGKEVYSYCKSVKPIMTSYVTNRLLTKETERITVKCFKIHRYSTHTHMYLYTRFLVFLIGNEPSIGVTSTLPFGL